MRLSNLVTGKCGGSWRSRRLRIPMRTYAFQAFAQPKPLHQSTRNFALLITSVRSPNVPEMVRIGRLGAAPLIGKIYGLVSFPFTRYCIFTVSFPALPFSCIVLQTRPLDRFCAHDASDDAVWSKEVCLGVLFSPNFV
jgi:hypothetical protein